MVERSAEVVDVIPGNDAGPQGEFPDADTDNFPVALTFNKGVSGALLDGFLAHLAERIEVVLGPEQLQGYAF